MTERSVLVRLRANVSDFNRGMAEAGVATKAFVKDLESSNDRMSTIVQSALALGPALVPVGAALVPVLSGITAGLGFAAVGAGATALAFSGVGDALKALNDYQLEPTDAHLRKLNETMGALGPAGRDFAMELQHLRPELQKLQDTAQEGMLPGVTDGIETLMQRMPEVQGILKNVSESIGGLMRDAGANLADPRWTKFFDYIKTEAGPALDEMGHAVGLIVEGISNMVMAFDPLNGDFFTGLVNVSTAFRDWSAGLGESDGFQHFLEYVQKVGPEVWQTLGAIANALIDIVTAAAPVGEGVLVGLKVFAETLSTIAESPAGPALIGIAAGLSAVSRAVAIFSLVNGSAITKLLGNVKAFKLSGTVIPSMSQFGTVVGRLGQSAAYANENTLAARSAVRGFASAVGPAVGIIGGLALATSGVADKVGLQNTALFASVGLMAGPYGFALGAAVGLTKDFAAANNESADALAHAQATLSSGDTSQYADELDRLRAALDKLATDGGFSGNMARISAEISGQRQQFVSDAEFLKAGMHDAEIGAGDLSSVMGDALAPSLDTTKDSFERASIGADAYKDSLEGINAFLDKRSAFRAYQAAIDDAGENLQKRAELQRKINETEADGAAERAKIRTESSQGGADTAGDLREQRRKLADAQFDAKYGKTATQRQNASQTVLDIQKRIADIETNRGRDVASKNDQITESYKRQTDAVKELKDQLKDLAPNAHAGNKGGRDNGARLDDIARKAVNLAGFMDDGFARNRLLANARGEYIKRAETFGIDPKKARHDATKAGLLAMPVAPPPLKIDADTKPAREKLGTLEKQIKAFEKRYHLDIEFGDTTVLARLDQLLDKLARIRHRANVQVHVDGRLGPITSAAGNVLSGGDIANGHLAAVYGASAVPRVFAEPETKGESYIPHANDWRRPRALSIWEETGRILGVQFRHFATGDVVRGSYAPAPSYGSGGGMSDYDVSRISSALLASRPLYGDVHVKDGTEFRRHLEADQVAQAGGGRTTRG